MAEDACEQEPTRSTPPTTREIGLVFRSALREVCAAMRQSLLLHRDWRTVVQPNAFPSDDWVVFLHGFLASAGVFRPLRKRVERSLGMSTLGLSYRPGTRLTDLASCLARLLACLPSHSRLHLVGHSIGGIAARYYAEVLPSDLRVVQTISLASPFAGVRTTTLPSFLAQDVGVDSQVLLRLANPNHAPRVPHLSVVASHDQFVHPSSASYPFGDVVVVRATSHNSILYDEAAAQHVINRLASPQKQPFPRAPASRACHPTSSTLFASIRPTSSTPRAHHCVGRDLFE